MKSLWIWLTLREYPVKLGIQKPSVKLWFLLWIRLVTPPYQWSVSVIVAALGCLLPGSKVCVAAPTPAIRLKNLYTRIRWLRHKLCHNLTQVYIKYSTEVLWLMHFIHCLHVITQTDPFSAFYILAFAPPNDAPCTVPPGACAPPAATG